MVIFGHVDNAQMGRVTWLCYSSHSHDNVQNGLNSWHVYFSLGPISISNESFKNIVLNDMSMMCSTHGMTSMPYGKMKYKFLFGITWHVVECHYSWAMGHIQCTISKEISFCMLWSMIYLQKMLSFFKQQVIYPPCTTRI